MSLVNNLETEKTIAQNILNEVKSKKHENGDPSLIPVFDDSAFPIINVVFSKTLDRAAFDIFLKKWLDCYTKQKNFTFIFDLQKITWINPTYSLLVVKFMKQLRLHINELSYLKISILIINNDFIRSMIYYIFKVQQPISHIYLVSSQQQALLIANGDENAKKFSINIPPNTLLK